MFVASFVVVVTFGLINSAPETSKLCRKKLSQASGNNLETSTDPRFNDKPVSTPVPNDGTFSAYTSPNPDPTHPRDNPEWTQPPGPSDEKSREFWQFSGQQILRETLDRKQSKKVAKNLIILVADGMSIPTQMATRMYKGGEQEVLSFEKFPSVGLSKVKKKRIFILIRRRK